MYVTPAAVNCCADHLKSRSGRCCFFSHGLLAINMPCTCIPLQPSKNGISSGQLCRCPIAGFHGRLAEVPLISAARAMQGPCSGSLLPQGREGSGGWLTFCFCMCDALDSGTWCQKGTVMCSWAMHCFAKLNIWAMGMVQNGCLVHAVSELHLDDHQGCISPA